MSRRPIGKRSSKSKIILVFGESENDRSAIKSLVEAIRPNLPKIETRRSPIVLRSDAHQKKRMNMCEDIVNQVRVANIVSNVVCVIAHRDCDAIEPAHENERDKLLKDMNDKGLPNPIAATPAYEIESWWYLWPAAVSKTRTCWKKIEFRGSAGKIVSAKEALRRDLRPQGNSRNCPDYEESDSLTIAENVKNLGIVRSPINNTASIKSESFSSFVSQIDTLKV